MGGEVCISERAGGLSQNGLSQQNTENIPERHDKSHGKSPPFLAPPPMAVGWKMVIEL